MVFFFASELDCFSHVMRESFSSFVAIGWGERRRLRLAAEVGRKFELIKTAGKGEKAGKLN
jgi:hypothetical protein